MTTRSGMPGAPSPFTRSYVAERAETELALAQALDASHGDRVRARALARAARADAAHVGRRGEAALKAANAWLAGHQPD